MKFRFLNTWTFLLPAVVLALTAGSACADPQSAPVSAFLAARRQAAGALLTGAGAADAVHHPGSYAGRTLDVAATVSGLVTAGDDRTALLSVGGDSVSVPVPAGWRGVAWLDSGARVRALLAVAPDDAALPSGLRLVAVVPEGDVVATEKAQEARRQAALARTLPFVSAAQPARRGRGRVALASDTGGRPAGALSARALNIYGPYRALVRRWNRRLSEADVDKITTSILYFSDINNMDPRLVVATIIAESDFDVNSTSRTGAMGLAQLMPETARGMGVTNAYDPIQNIGASVRILRGHLDQYGGAPADAGVIPLGQIALAMAAYNAGPGAVRKYHGVPPYRETRRYINRITTLYRQMCGLSQQASTK